jgi:inner membrane protein
MPSLLSHAMIAVAAGSAVAPRPLLKPFLVVGALCAVLPDIDAFGRLYGAGDVAALGGHRGFTHSMAGAVSVGLVVAVATLPSERWAGHRLRFGLFIVLVTAAHGLLDAFTSIGAVTSPVQVFSPFSTQGYTAPWQPIDGPFSELFLILLPLMVLTRAIWYRRGIPWPRRDADAIRLTLSGEDRRS